MVPKRLYVPRKFNDKSLTVIDQANDICRDYIARGYDLTLRQVYYQFVARGLVPNRDTEYKRLGSIINDGRMAGLIDWNYITDRTRNIRRNSHWDSPSNIIDGAANSYDKDRWEGQDERLEVWIEKDALVGVIAGPCEDNDVAHFSCRGYTSASEMWAAANRIRGHIAAGHNVTLLHLGDHDPSGIDMSRDIEDRLATFIAVDLQRLNGWSRANVVASFQGPTPVFRLERIALNMDQIEEYSPPPNPAKLTDSRGSRYVDEYGDESWELDALDPDVLAGLVEEKILEHRDGPTWDERCAEIETEREVLRAVADRWEDVREFVEGDAA